MRKSDSPADLSGFTKIVGESSEAHHVQSQALRLNGDVCGMRPGGLPDVHQFQRTGSHHHRVVSLHNKWNHKVNRRFKHADSGSRMSQMRKYGDTRLERKSEACHKSGNVQQVLQVITLDVFWHPIW